MAVDNSGLWTVVEAEARSCRVKVIRTWSSFLHLDKRGVRLIRHAPRRGGGLVLVVAAGLDAEAASIAALFALGSKSKTAWRAYAEAVVRRKRGEREGKPASAGQEGPFRGGASGTEAGRWSPNR